jgi:serine phosphatase RsbU (regulator of sigma subunit)
VVATFLDPALSLHFFAQASAVVTAAEDVDAALSDVVQLAVPDLADWCTLDVLHPEGEQRQVVSVHPDPRLGELLLELRRRFRAETGRGEGVAKAMDSQRPVLYHSHQSGGPLLELTDSERSLYEQLSPQSTMILPLIARGRSIGALTFLSCRADRLYGSEDVALMEDLASRLALLIDHARLKEEAERTVELQRQALRRASFLARAGELLDSSLDYEQTLQTVAEIAVPDIADWCAMHMLQPDGTLKLVAVRHADPDQMRLAQELQERYPPDPNAPQGAQNVVRTGITEAANELPDELLVQGAVDEGHLALIRKLGLRAYVVAPLVARGRAVGALTMIGAETKSSFSPEDVELAQELGRRAGLSIENARLYTERVNIAHTLQTRLLPDRLPDVPGVDLAARYRAAGELLEVGGDFFDVCPGVDGSWVLFVGDVSGKGAEAAAATAMIRFTLRAAAHAETSPAGMLGALNEAMEEGGLFCTVALGRLHEGRLTLSLGGHPPAYVLRADGTVEEAGRYGTVMGSVDDALVHDVEVPLGPGDTVLLYTDGVIEGGSAQGALGEDGLQELLRSLTGEPVQAIVDRVVDEAVRVQNGVPRDDIALLALRVRG